MITQENTVGIGIDKKTMKELETSQASRVLMTRMETAASGT